MEDMVLAKKKAQEVINEKFSRFITGIGVYSIMFGVTGYDIQVYLTNDDGVHAAVDCDPDNYTAVFAYNAELDETPEHTALHEVLHVFMARYRSLAQYRFATEKEIDAEEEKIVRTLSKIILNLSK